MTQAEKMTDLMGGGREMSPFTHDHSAQASERMRAKGRIHGAGVIGQAGDTRFGNTTHEYAVGENERNIEGGANGVCVGHSRSALKVLVIHIQPQGTGERDHLPQLETKARIRIRFAEERIDSVDFVFHVCTGVAALARTAGHKECHYVDGTAVEPLVNLPVAVIVEPITAFGAVLL
jgi:hypothetical protein